MSNQENPNSQFLSLFSRFESYLAGSYEGESSSQRVDSAYKDPVFERRIEELGLTRDDVHNLRQLRNIIAHSPQYVSVSESALTDINKIVLSFCDKAVDIATQKPDVYAASLSTYVKDIIENMNDRDFSYVPIVDESQFLGLFSKHVILRLLADNKLHDDIKVRDIISYITQHDSEHGFEFLPITASARRAYQLFEDYINRGKHLGVIFLTDDGKESGDIKGVITAWDLYKRE